MERKKIYVSVCVLGVLLALTLGSGLAQEPAERAEPQGTLAVEAVVSSKFTYQGMLRESGTPVTGARDMVFCLFSDDVCTEMVGADISMPGVQVDEGLFSVELSVSPADVDGQGLWLGIQIGGTTVGCQEILPVPYALSLRPGAIIEGDQEFGRVLQVVNTAATGWSYGVYARTDATQGKGVFGWASATSGQTFGVYGVTHSSSGAGVYARGWDEGADLILGGNGDSGYGDDGRIVSDPYYASSDIYLITNDGLRIDLDEDGNGEDADFEILNGDNTRIFNVDESGDVTFGGTGIAAFPRPAWDSGWLSLGQGDTSIRAHGLLGNTDNYVVDLTCRKSAAEGANNWGVGGDANGSEYYGAWWSHLTTSAITIHRWSDDSDCPNFRVRIWVYP